jgi:hypothetical protein
MSEDMILLGDKDKLKEHTVFEEIGIFIENETLKEENKRLEEKIQIVEEKYNQLLEERHRLARLVGIRP